MRSEENTVSIVTANFNHGHLIRRVVQSVADQGYPILEHIIVDDASTDDSRSIIEETAREYPFVRLVTLDRNVGPPLAFARGICEAKGHYLQLLAADDILTEHSIRRRMQVAEQNPEAKLICGDIELEFSELQMRKRIRFAKVDHVTYFAPRDVVSQQRMKRNIFNGGASLVDREEILRVNFDPQLRWHCDWFSFSVIAYRHGAWYVPEVLHRCTLSKSNYSLGGGRWPEQEQVLAHLFELLRSPEFSNLRSCYRKSGILGTLPHMYTYFQTHRSAWNFLTPRIVLFWLLSISLGKARRLYRRIKYIRAW